MRTTVARRVIAGAALVVGLPLATAGLAAAQSTPSQPGEPSQPSGPSGPGGSTTSTSTATSLLTTTTTRSGTSGTGGLPRTGGDLAVPLAAAGGAIAVVLGGRRLVSRA